jgi:hypothetical protein
MSVFGGTAPPGAQFQKGSPEADVLRHLVVATNGRIKRLVGHSKGALAIAHTINFGQDKIPADLEVATFGCSIQRNDRPEHYAQFLGAFDPLGWVNSSAFPDNWPKTWHSTNTRLPFSMDVKALLGPAGNPPPSPQASV